MYRLGIDVGGTNTDAVLIDESLEIIAGTKIPTTADIQKGILAAVKEILETTDIERSQITRAMLGTTQCTNAIVERKQLAKVGILRIGAPATTGIRPMIDWDEDLKSLAKAVTIIEGGFEYDGKELTALNKQAAYDFFRSIEGAVESIAISCVFSTVRNDHEHEIEKVCREVLGDEIPITLSSTIGSMGLIERENATILNAALYKVSKSFTEGFAQSLKEHGVTNAELYISQNDGTLMTMEDARKYPILTIACGPTNSIRGASFLSHEENAIVLDLGGTTTDVGVLQNGFPRESSIAVTIGGVRTNFRMPDVISFGLGGGSIIREESGVISIGPDSVGFELTTKAKVFGGNVLTATDIAVKLGMADIGDATLLADISDDFAQRAMFKITEMVEDNLDAMKISSDDVTVILVGGGSILIPSKLKGAKEVIRPGHFAIANAIGSAISKVSGTYEQLVDYDLSPREEALKNAQQEAIEAAVLAGASRETVIIIDMEDVPLSYHPGNTCRIKVKAAGELR